MGSRSPRLRTKLAALVASLAALWAVAAWDVLRDATDVFRARTLHAMIGDPGEPLMVALQSERRLSVVYLARPGGPQRTALEASRQQTTELAARFTASARTWQADLAADDDLVDRIDDVVNRLDRLSRTRAVVDDRSVDRPAAAQAFTEVVDALFGAYAAMDGPNDEGLGTHATALVQVQRVRELVAQEDALVAGAIAAGRLSSAEYVSFTRLVGAHRFLARSAAGGLPSADRRGYQQVSNGPAASRLRTLEDRIVQSGRPGAAPPVDAVDWRNAAEATQADLRQIVSAGGDSLADRSASAVAWVVTRLVLVVGLGLLVVLAAIITSATTVRVFARRLRGLGETGRLLADERLPAVLTRLDRGEQVDIASEVPPLPVGPDEFQAVDRAFNAVREIAIRVTADQVRSRRTERQVLLALARRTEALVHRQLTLLDAMERREPDAEELADLFRVDLLATRVRRNTENLIRLSDSSPGRAWLRDVPMVEVVRAALAEVADHPRVTVLPLGAVAVTGPSAGDLIHLLAELIENALSCSPPYTPVEVRGLTVGNGFVVEIEDRGLGMGRQELADANAAIVGPAELGDPDRLGLYVVRRLAERHDVKVQFKESPYGGTTAVVLIPRALVVELDGQAADHVGGPDPVPDAPRVGPDPPPPVDPGAAAGDEPVDGEAEDPAEVGSEVLGDMAGVAAGDRVPGSGEPVAGARPPATGPDSRLSAVGLPVRVRQANLVVPLREPAPAVPPILTSARPPDQVRRLMNSYQMGTRRGRTAAAELLADDHRDPPGGDDRPDDDGTGDAVAAGPDAGPAAPTGNDRDIS